MSRPMTLTQMIAEVYSRLGEQSGFYTDATITQWLNDGVDEIAISLEPVIADATIDIVASTFEYLLPEDLISIKTVLTLDSNSNWVNMTETTLESLFRNDPAWESVTSGAPATHWYWKENTLGIFPVPSANVTAGVRIIFTCRPEEMSDGTDTTGLSSYMDRVAILYAVFRARLKDRDDQKAVLARGEWEKSVALASTLINKQRKDNAPKLEARQQNYRTWWYNRTPRFRAISE